jgi:hypothetical protein
MQFQFIGKTNLFGPMADSHFRCSERDSQRIEDNKALPGAAPKLSMTETALPTTLSVPPTPEQYFRRNCIELLSFRLGEQFQGRVVATLIGAI